MTGENDITNNFWGCHVNYIWSKNSLRGHRSLFWPINQSIIIITIYCIFFFICSNVSVTHEVVNKVLILDAKNSVST